MRFCRFLWQREVLFLAYRSSDLIGWEFFVLSLSFIISGLLWSPPFFPLLTSSLLFNRSKSNYNEDFSAFNEAVNCSGVLRLQAACTCLWMCRCPFVSFHVGLALVLLFTILCASERLFLPFHKKRLLISGSLTELIFTPLNNWRFPIALRTIAIQPSICFHHNSSFKLLLLLLIPLLPLHLPFATSTLAPPPPPEDLSVDAKSMIRHAAQLKRQFPQNNN